MTATQRDLLRIALVVVAALALIGIGVALTGADEAEPFPAVCRVVMPEDLER